MLDETRSTVLVAADDPAIVDTYAHWLGDEYNIITAYGGADAVERLSGMVDAAVLDRRMSGTPGDAVVDAIRERDIDCRVVFRTPAEPPTDDGFDAFLVSPTDPETLQTTVRGVLDSADDQVAAAQGVRRDGANPSTDATAQSPPTADRESTRGGFDALVRELVSGLSQVGTREELEQAVCDRLFDLRSYPCVWVGRCTATTDRLTLQAVTGADQFDSPAMLAAAPDPVRRTAATGEVSVGRYEPDGDGTLDEALPASVDGGWIAAVPLVHRDAMYGLVTVHSPEKLDEEEVAALADIGDVLAYGISAVECRKLLVADTAVELELRLDNRVDPMVDIGAELGCELSLDGLVPTDRGVALCYVTVDGATPEAFVAAAEERVDGVRPVGTRDQGGTFELQVSGDSILQTLLATGAVPQGLTVTEGSATVTAEVAPDADVRAVVEALRSAFDGADLLAQRQVSPSIASRSRFRSSLANDLTEQQRAALEAAYAADYFEWPRGTTAEELAESMGIASPTLHQHLRAAKRKLLEAYFREAGGPPQEKQR